MGAALTYARRYALFTLVGIAGEDDLDAPDLGVNLESHTPIQPNDQPAPREDVAADRANGPRSRKRHQRTSKLLLEAHASDVLREELISRVSRHSL